MLNLGACNITIGAYAGNNNIGEHTFGPRKHKHIIVYLFFSFLAFAWILQDSIASLLIHQFSNQKYPYTYSNINSDYNGEFEVYFHEMQNIIKFDIAS